MSKEDLVGPPNPYGPMTGSGTPQNPFNIDVSAGQPPGTGTGAPPSGGGGGGGGYPQSPLAPGVPPGGPNYPVDPLAPPGTSNPPPPQAQDPKGFGVGNLPPGLFGGGGDGSNSIGYTGGDPNLPFEPNFGAAPPGGNYQPPQHDPQWSPWFPQTYRGGQTDPGNWAPQPFGSPGDGPPDAAGGGGGGISGTATGGGGQPEGTFNPNDPYNVYLSQVPVMQNEMRDSIFNAMSQIAPGNRFSTAMGAEAGRIGAETGLKQNSLLMNTLYNHSQQDLNRGLEATGMGFSAAAGDADRMQRGEQIGGQFASEDLQRMLQAANAGTALGGTQEDIQRQRLMDLYGAGAGETSRNDRINQIPYEDFMQSRKGYLPELMNLTGVSQGTNQPAVTTATAGKPGVLDYGTAALPWLQAFGVF